MTLSAPPPRAHGDAAPVGDPAPWHRRHRRLVGLAGAALALGMTVVWVAVVPDKAETTTGLQSWALRWGHPASWACLTGAGAAFAVDAPRRVRELLAWSALGTYAAFLLALTL